MYFACKWPRLRFFGVCLGNLAVAVDVPRAFGVSVHGAKEKASVLSLFNGQDLDALLGVFLSKQQTQGYDA